MEMMAHMMMMDQQLDHDHLPPDHPQQIPFHHLISDHMEFSGAGTNHQLIINYPPPPPSLMMTQSPLLQFRTLPQRGGGMSSWSFHHQPPDSSSVEAMREMIFRIAALQPVQIDPESIKAPKRRNVKISKDPQSVAARHRRERISERIRILQRLVPGGTKMDTASMLDEAAHYMKFLKNQVRSLEQAASTGDTKASAVGCCTTNTNMNNSHGTNNNNSHLLRVCGQPASNVLG